MMRRRAQTGFTLVEILITVTLLGVMTALFMNTYLDVYRIAFSSDAKNLINRDVRTVTTQLAHTAREASYFVLYRSFSSLDRADSKKRLAEGKSGDFVVFVFLEKIVDSTDLGHRPIERIIGYYRDVKDASEAAPVRRFERVLTSAQKKLKLEAILPAASSSGEHGQVIELSEGLANGRLFYNLWNTSVMVNGRVLHGNSAKWVTDTYNFTVSPRGMQM
jgi:prepilin-type N-terminal cleavage/methylation domain-containing protein